MNKVYIEVDENNHIINYDNSAYKAEMPVGWIELYETEKDTVIFMCDNMCEEQPMLNVEDENDPLEGSWRFIYENGDVRYATTEEKQAWIDAKYSSPKYLRLERDAIFEKYDKYQLIDVRTELTEQQILEYQAWRQSWLDVTETKVKPNIPEWFN